MHPDRERPGYETMTVIDFEPDSSTDFADPCARLLNAALDEKNRRSRQTCENAI
jgi:hypothetical protein